MITIQNFLKENKFQWDKLEGDTLEYLQNASSRIAEIFEDNKEQAISYLLAALIPTTKNSEIVFQEVEDAICEEWTTFATSSKTGDIATTIYKAVIWEAVSNWVNENIDNQQLLLFSFCNIMSFIPAYQSSKLPMKFFEKTKEQVEKKAMESWQITEASITQELKLALNIAILPSTNLSTNFKNAVTNQMTAPNQQVNYNALQPQIIRITEELAQHLNSEFDKNNKIISGLVKGLVNEFEKQIQTIQKQILDNFTKSSKNTSLQTQLLWWKETGYSKLQKTSYKKLNPYTLLLTMAYEYAELIPCPFPQSAVYFLRAVLESILPNANETIKFSTFIDNFLANKSDLKKLELASITDEKNALLIDFLAALLDKTAKKEDFSKNLGIDSEAEISFVDLLIWLFYDFQLLKLLRNDE